MASLFFSYSHEDEDLRDQLEVHFAMLKREALIDAWHDRKILAGEEFDGTIDQKLEEADVILLLISADFLASRYCYDIEVERAMQRHEEGSTRVIPVILRPCDWHSAPFGHLLAAPKDGKPVTRWTDKDEAFVDIVHQIRAVLPALTGRTRSPHETQLPVARAMSPRSSNLRVRKRFNDADRDTFIEDAFEHMGRFFENSLDELGRRNSEIKSRFKRVDAHLFTVVIYRNGEEVSRCAIRHGGSQGFANGITYSSDPRGMGNSYNEQLTVESDEQALFLNPSGMQMSMINRQAPAEHLTFDGAAEYYWEMLIEPLQR